GPVVTANLVTAGLIVLLPFTTQGISDPEISEYPLPTALYAVNVALAMASQWAMHEIGRVRGLLVERVSPALLRASRIDVLAQMGVFAVSVPIAFLAGSTWAQLSWLLMIPVGRITGKRKERVAELEHSPGVSDT